jgi:hypothetical protein
MRVIDIVSFAILLIVFYFLMGDQGTNFSDRLFKPKNTEQKIKFYESAFEQGLPQAFYPPDTTFYASEEKLKQDLGYRKERFNYALRDELEEFKQLPGSGEDREWAYQELNSTHRAAIREMNQKHKELLEQYRQNKFDEESENKGLR